MNERDQAILRQQEFPQMLRDLVDTGAQEIEICVNAATAIKIAEALELYNVLTGVTP
jgi:predicted aldo/keto reductase-like oxidoreductase